MTFPPVEEHAQSLQGRAPAVVGEPVAHMTRSLRILVGIANYGVRNRAYLDRLIDEYRSMPFLVDICIFAEKPKSYPADVTVHVGLPIANPWSLPFAHRPVFAAKADDYDLFIYSEDDTLIEARHITAFLSASRSLEAGLVPGFIRYEQRPDGARSYPDIHGAYRWIADSVRRSGVYTHARLTNDHSACYLLTRDQLRSAIASGGYLVEPHGGRYDMLCSAGTDAYTQCGLSRVICISHLEDFEIHHLPDAYVKGNGMIDKDCAVLERDGLLCQVEALAAIEAGRLSGAQSFDTEKRLSTQRWDKSYYEPRDDALLALVPPTATRILSIGCGSGRTESSLVEAGKQVVAIPLDAVIGRVAARSDIHVLPPDLASALAQLQGQRFDAILLADIVQHLPDPVEFLSGLSLLLAPSGQIVGSAPNLGPVRRWPGRLFGKNSHCYRFRGHWQASKLHLTSAGGLRRWLACAGLRVRQVAAAGDFKANAPAALRTLMAPSLYFVAERTSRE
jgi:2-polyprenyl-3-methyl-5-hydroxy-6-metoxy-1,4-benzoquinol methylase